MSNSINTNTSGLRVQIDSSRARQTPKTDFGSVFQTGLSKTADTVMDAGQLAAPFVPGGAVLSAAITGLGGLKSKGAASSAAASPNAVVVSSGGSSQGVGSASTGSTSSSGGAANGEMDMMSRSENMMEMNQKFNLEYLNLQQDMQAENRKFTTLSNVMKTKHDTAKATINNVR